MIYPSLGISIIAHLFVITTVKVKNFLGFKTNKKSSLNNGNSLFKKMFQSFVIAFVVESIFLLVIVSSIVVADVGILSANSNLNIIKSVYHDFENKQNSSACAANKICYIKIKNNLPDASISLG